jgi:hypothetical protein
MVKTEDMTITINGAPDVLFLLNGKDSDAPVVVIF